jgi:hypothetical protein
MGKVTAIAMVIDRPTSAGIAADIKEFGGAWVEMFDMWRKLSPMQYLVMLAHTDERIRKRAPLTAMAASDDTLRLILKQFCDELAGMQCHWALFIEKGSTAESIARAELLLDAKAVGTA